MNINVLMSLTESATGFNGGSYIDEMPEMSLDEAINTLPVVIVESQMSFTTRRGAQNEALVEATINAITGGYKPEYMTIAEASFEDIKKNIKAFFDRLLKFLRSIIEKLKLRINKIRMSGSQLYAKYKDSDMLKNKKWTDLHYNGYDIMGADKDNIFPNAAKYKDVNSIQELMVIATGSTADKTIMDPMAFNARYNNSNNTEETIKEAKEALDKLNNITGSDRAYNIAKELIGNSVDSMSKDGWESSCRARLYKEKIDIKYGDKGYTLDRLSEMLQNPTDLMKVRDEYVQIEQAAKMHNANLDKAADQVKNEIEANSSSKEEGAKIKTEALSTISSYFTTYMGYVSSAYGVISQVKNIKLKFYETRNKQAKAMFGKMLSYKEPKTNNNNASDLDDLDVIMDFAL